MLVTRVCKFVQNKKGRTVENLTTALVLPTRHLQRGIEVIQVNRQSKKLLNLQSTKSPSKVEVKTLAHVET